MKKTILLSLFMLLVFVELPDVAAEAAADKKVVINGTHLTAKDIQSLERSYGVPLISGSPWASTATPFVQSPSISLRSA